MVYGELVHRSEPIDSRPGDGRRPDECAADRGSALLAAIRTSYVDRIAKNTTSIRLPEELIDTLVRKAAAQGTTRSQLIVQAVEHALTDQSAWSSDFLKAIGSRRPELEEAVDAMMDAIRARRSRSDAPGP